MQRCGASMSQGRSLAKRRRLVHPRTRERCDPEISGVRAGRGDGVCVAASSKLVNGCRWKRDEPGRVFLRAPTNGKKRGGVQKTHPRVAPLQSSTPGACSTRGLLVLARLFVFSAPRFEQRTRPGDCSMAVAEFLGSSRPSWPRRCAHQHGRSSLMAQGPPPPLP